MPNEDNNSELTVRFDNVLDKTEKHLAMLCRAFGSIAQYSGESKALDGMEIPEELKKKATDSCVQLLHQVDNVVNDMARWTLAPSVVEKHYAEALRHAAALTEAQTMQARIATLPSSRLPMHLHQYAEGRWGAYLVQNGAATLIGSGKTIQDAINDFDMNVLEAPEKTSRQPRKKRAKKVDGPKSNEGAGPA